MNPSTCLKISQVLGYFAAGTTKRTSSILDMSGYEGVVFVIGLGTTIENGTLDGFVEQHTLNQTSGMARLATTGVHTVTAANAALVQSAIIIDVNQPVEQFVQCNITPAVSNAVVLGIVAIQYSGRVDPQGLAASVIKRTILSGPAEA